MSWGVEISVGVFGKFGLVVGNGSKIWVIGWGEVFLFIIGMLEMGGCRKGGVW